MSDRSDPQPSVRRCDGCNAVVERGVRFCSSCGRDLTEIEPKQAPPSSTLEFLERSPDEQTTTRSDIQRRGTPEWLAVVLGVIAVAVVWFVISRPSVETEATDVFPTSTSRNDSADTVQTAESDEPARSEEQATTSSTRPARSVDQTGSTANADAVANAPGTPSAPLDELSADGWGLLVGDGQTIVEVDLSTGTQRRNEQVGAPLAVVDGRLLVYRDSRLAWSDLDDLTQTSEEIVEVAALQRMFTRGRSAERPVVVDEGPDIAIWWPNNNANPQTWIKIRLDDGTVLDSIALTETVYGGPEVVATVGSGTFERIDGRWVAVGDLFASSASQEAIVGQQCVQPDACDWVLVRRDEPTSSPERLAIPVGGPFDVRLVPDADRILLLQSGGVTDHATGTFVPVFGADGESVTAVNRSNLLALADGANIGLRSSVVTLIDLDGQPGRSVSRIAIDDIVPRWLVLIPPQTP